MGHVSESRLEGARQRGTNSDRGGTGRRNTERSERVDRPVGRRNIQMWIWRIVSSSRPNLSFVSWMPPIPVSLWTTCTRPLPAGRLFPPTNPLFSASRPFRSRNRRFLIIPPPCAIVQAGQSATKPTPALSARDIRQYPNERSTGETGWKGTRSGKDVLKVEKGGRSRSWLAANLRCHR